MEVLYLLEIYMYYVSSTLDNMQNCISERPPNQSNYTIPSQFGYAELSTCIQIIACWSVGKCYEFQENPEKIRKISHVWLHQTITVFWARLPGRQYKETRRRNWRVVSNVLYGTVARRLSLLLAMCHSLTQIWDKFYQFLHCMLKQFTEN